MKPFSLLIKPASADCNLHCDYCFYLDRDQLYPTSRVHRMGPAVLERMISSFLKLEMDHHVFMWQGGEPTLMGLDFFREVTRLQVKHGRPGTRVVNGLQTNGLRLDDEFARHLARYKFLVGVSLDGPAAIHDRHRKTAAGGGSHARVLVGIEHLRRQRVEFNILTLVTAANVHRAVEIYDYLTHSGFNYLQFIPCVEFCEQGRPLPYAVGGRAWGKFLCQLFDRWYPKDTRRVSIRLFDSLLALLVNNERNVCHLDRNCCQYLVVEHNGDVYPCDFFVQKELLLGNLDTHGWEQLQAAPAYRQFGKQKTRWHQNCSGCKFLGICSGDCLKHRLRPNQTEPRTPSWLCEGWQLFYRHSLPRLKRLAAELKSRHGVHPKFNRH